MLAFLLAASILFPPAGKGYYCTRCHTDQQLLKKLRGENYRKVWVDPSFLQTKMGKLGCVFCHGGNDAPSGAHRGLVKDPSNPPSGKPVCLLCHREKTEKFLSSSLHFNVNGIREVFEKRMGKEDAEETACREIFKGRCGACHATCGSCHVSLADRKGGGLLASHKFLKTPPAESCRACHSGIFEQMQGKGKQLPDVHWEKKRMGCLDCHSGREMHGDGNIYSNSKLSPSPTCRGCHLEAEESNVYHQVHFRRLACQVCHAQAVERCYSCHKEGETFRVERRVRGIKIGKNYIPGRSCKYILVAHVPVSPQTFRDMCGAEPAAFSSMPTWKIALPHSIRARTERAATCGACHNNPSLFLTRNDLEDYEREANSAVLVDLEEIPRFYGKRTARLFTKYIIPPFLALLLLHAAARIATSLRRKP